MKKILFVDDEADLLKVSSIRLKKNDYEVFGAMDGQEALDLAGSKMPDLIILGPLAAKLFGGVNRW